MDYDKLHCIHGNLLDMQRLTFLIVNFIKYKIVLPSGKSYGI